MSDKEWLGISLQNQLRIRVSKSGNACGEASAPGMSAINFGAMALLLARPLKPDPEHRQQPLQNRCQAHQYHQNLEQIAKPPVTDEPVNQPEQDRADDNRD